MARASVIIPTHNRAKLLLRAIESAKRTAVDVEVIVVVDASTDDAVSVCRDQSGAARQRRAI
jgi:glycosyltransferase involved in cell wall biosynthesis